MKGYIYKITNSITHQIYIGQTTRSVEFRWWQHKYPNSKMSLLKRAIKEYGENSFIIEILEEICHENRQELSILLNAIEIKYIKENNSLYPNGYNVLKGGKHSPHTPESKEKIAASKRGKKRPDMLKHMDKIHEKCKKKVICNETGQIWNSVKECASFFKVKPKQISRVLKGQRKRLKWQFTFSYLPQS